jgi:GTP cyclohydrolase I
MLENIRRILTQIGENPDREGLRRTPERFEEALRFLTRGYKLKPEEVLNGAVFEQPYDEMVMLRHIDYYSLCEHHLIPFFGKCHAAYIPNGRILGLSKIPRIVDMFARRLQVQERMTMQIAECIQEAITPLGVAVIVEGFHLCMAMRGVEKQNCWCVTSAMLGAFRTDHKTRNEFLQVCGLKH